MILLLEGHVVRFAAPKATHDKEIGFCNTLLPLPYQRLAISVAKSCIIDDREKEMTTVW